MLPMRLYTAGIADFERIRQDGRIYIDKTDLIYKLSQESQFVFLSRPRRFGKSLLCSTLKYYFQGRKDLFEEMRRFNTNLLELEQLQVPSSLFDVPTEGMSSALPLLYQSGYLTIKGYDFNRDLYTLDFPNAEVKVGFMENFHGVKPCQ